FSSKHRNPGLTSRGFKSNSSKGERERPITEPQYVLLTRTRTSELWSSSRYLDPLQQKMMVMEYMEHDMKSIMETKRLPFSQSEVKCLMLQLLEGVEYLHDNWVLHRDFKNYNIIINNQGELKICECLAYMEAH
ncbi:hypothetical protein MKX03_005513, partial [Papaver bracteatum]